MHRLPIRWKEWELEVKPSHSEKNVWVLLFEKDPSASWAQEMVWSTLNIQNLDYERTKDLPISKRCTIVEFDVINQCLEKLGRSKHFKNAIEGRKILWTHAMPECFLTQLVERCKVIVVAEDFMSMKQHPNLILINHQDLEQSITELEQFLGIQLTEQQRNEVKIRAEDRLNEKILMKNYKIHRSREFYRDPIMEWFQEVA